MAIGGVLLVVVILIVLIWLSLEFRTFRHKFWAFLLVILIIFTYFSFTSVIKGKDVDLKTASGIFQAGKFYFSWLGSVFVNLKTITANAIHMDWRGSNQTSENTERG